MARQLPNFRLGLAKAILGNRAKDFIPALNPVDGVSMPGSIFGGRINNYETKGAQMSANVGWVFTANAAIADPTAAVKIKLYRKLKDGDREEITTHEILELIEMPNIVHTGEQMRQLHFTYMNLVGESYILMKDLKGNPFIPAKGKLPASLEIWPAHFVSFNQRNPFSSSVIRYQQMEFPLTSFIRDINPDPNNPYAGRSIIAAASGVIDLEEHMTSWNRQLFANNARPSLIFQSDHELSNEAYERWKKNFTDMHTGTDNAYRPILIEGGKATPWMLTQQDLDFLESRKFSRDEILAMFRLSPAMLGMVENVNRANMEAGFYINAVINIVPRIRQFVNQLNASLVRLYDPTLELDFESPIPEDVEMKLRAAEAGVDKWWTKDEVRAMYGEEPLPNGIGEHIVVSAKGAPVPLEAIVGDLATNGTPEPVENPEDPDDDGDDDLTEDPGGEDEDTKSQVAQRQKQVSARDFPGLYDDMDIDMDSLGCIMLDTEPLSITKHVDNAEADLVHSTDSHDHQMGAVAESEPHVTLLFGLLENGNKWKDKVDTVLDGWKMPKVSIEKVDAFDTGDAYAIVGHIKKTPEIIDGHERLTLLPHIQTFSEYKPHMTLAYVQHDKKVADKWVKALGAVYNGMTVKAAGINYGDPADDDEDSKGKTLNLSKKKDLSGTPDLAGLTGAEAAAATRERRGEQKAADYNRRGDAYEQRLLTVLRAQFERQREMILNNSLTVNLRGYSDGAERHVTKRAKSEYLGQLNDWSDSDRSMEEAIAPILYALIVETGRHAMTDLNLDPSMFDASSAKVLDYNRARAMKIATDVDAETDKQLRATISEGINAGEDDNQLRARIETVMGAALTYRADRIARTEVTRAQGFGDITAWEQSGVVTGREWYCVNDEKTCVYCRELDGRIVSLDSNFYSLGDIVHADGKTLNISYDNVISSPLHVSCRCQCLPITLPLSEF